MSTRGVTGHRTLLAAVAAVVLALGVSACGSSEDPLAQAAAAAPDLSQLGYEAIDCADTTAVGMTVKPVEDGNFIGRCWRGTPERPFYQEALALGVVVRNSTSGVIISEQVCPQPVLNSLAGIACSALLYGDEAHGAVLGIVVHLVDPAGAIGGLGESPTQFEVDAAVAGKQVEIFVWTDQTANSTPTQQPDSGEG